MPERSGTERENVNLTIQKAFITDVKNRGEDPAEAILGVDIKIKAEVPPSSLDEFSAEIRKRLFDDQGAPTITELGRCAWRTEYEKGDMTIAGIKVGDTGMLNISFEPMLNGTTELRLWARVSTSDKDLAGSLAMLIKQTVKITFKKMTQVPLIKAGAGEEEDEQEDLPGVPRITPLLPDKSEKAKAH